jgi:hypothetical protein
VAGKIIKATVGTARMRRGAVATQTVTEAALKTATMPTPAIQAFYRQQFRSCRFSKLRFGGMGAWAPLWAGVCKNEKAPTEEQLRRQTRRKLDDLAFLADGHLGKLECGTRNHSSVLLDAELATFGAVLTRRLTEVQKSQRTFLEERNT